MDRELLVLDIDGTVTDSRKKVLPETRKAVLEVQKKGVRVVLASGRPPEGVFPVAHELGLDRRENYILSFNGGRILNVQTGECVFEKCLPLHIPGKLWEDAQENHVGIAAYTPGIIVAGTEPDQYMELESRITGMRLEVSENFKQHMKTPVNECLITGDPDLLEIIEPALFHKYFHEAQVFHSEPFYLEVIPKNVDKAYGLKYLLRILGIPPERMVCCGDSFNDIRMLQYAGVGVAMANARDEIKAVANYVTVHDNDHDGIAEVIERFF